MAVVYLVDESDELMRVLKRAEANEAWNKLWDAMTFEWFKLEVLQDYSAEDKGESLDAWMAGDKERSIELIRNYTTEWAEDCAKKVKQGAKLTRIHVVDYPLSDYMQWEIEAYKNRNILRGKEDVYLVDRKDIKGITLPKGDMMLFDQKNVVVGNYNKSGYAASQNFYDSSDDISEFINLRSALLGSKLVKVEVDI